MTPLINPQSRQEMAYNEAHAKSRSVIERTNGILKGRWRCLDTSGGTLLYRPEKVCKIILACSVLHNIAMEHGLPDPEDIIIPDHGMVPPRLPNRHIDVPLAAIAKRQELILRF